jgi:hypothetical protein
MITFNSQTDSQALLRKPRRRANTMPWNQGTVTFGANSEPSESRNFSMEHYNLQPVLLSPQTPANKYTEQMDIEMEDVGKKSETESIGDWETDGNSPYLSNEYFFLTLR